jgi:ParB-like chromosome segregation protein Spo0J
MTEGNLCIYDDFDTMRVAEIEVGPRHRQDMGDIAALAASIADVGLLQPLVVDPDGRLIAGRRRLEAVRELKWTVVPVIITDRLDDAIKLLKAERDENTCRKDFTPSEAVTIGAAIEKLEKGKAQERKNASRAKKGEKVGAQQGGGNLPPPSGGKGKTRDKVAEAVGMSGRTYEKAKAVVAAAEKDPELAEAVREMDATGKVDGAYKKVKQKQAARAPEAREAPDAPTAAAEFDRRLADIHRKHAAIRFGGGLQPSYREGEDTERYLDLSVGQLLNLIFQIASVRAALQPCYDATNHALGQATKADTPPAAKEMKKLRAEQKSIVERLHDNKRDLGDAVDALVDQLQAASRK